MKNFATQPGWVFVFVLGAGFGLGCGGRSDAWDRPVGAAQAFGLVDAIAVSDPNADRVLLLTTDFDRHLSSTAVSIQRGVRTVMVAPDRSKLFVVSAGDGDARPPAGQMQQGPALEVISRKDGAVVRERYPLSEPLAGLALDPLGKWAVLFADKTSTSLVSNPNELLLVDLTRPADAGTADVPPNPFPRTLRSFGGQPQRFTFTDPLHLPGGDRRLLIVETEQDVAILDLLRLKDAEITIQLTSGLDTRQLHPAGVVVSDGDGPVDDARIAIRLSNDPSVVVAQLVPGTGRDFLPTLNLTDVGGMPSDAAFVRTDGGVLQLAVLVPSRSKAVLINPTTGLTQDVALPAPYQRLSLVTAEAVGTPATNPGASLVDVAMLWNGGGGVSTGGVAFWELGLTAGQPYRSVETVGVTTGVTAVVDVGGAHPELKILGTSAATFFLLDLKARTSAPFLTSVSGIQIAPSSAGDRAWVFLPNSTELSTVDLKTLHPRPMRIDRAVSSVFEIAVVDGNPPAGARSLVAWHQVGQLGATVYSAGDLAPSSATDTTGAIDDHRNYDGILTEGLQ